MDEKTLKEKQMLELMKKEIMRKILTKEALERLGRVRVVNPQLAEQLELYLLQLYQAGQIKNVIDDLTLKKLLSALTEKKSNKFRIIRK